MLLALSLVDQRLRTPVNGSGSHREHKPVGSKLLSLAFVPNGLLKLTDPKFVRDSFAQWNYPARFRVAVSA